jgi:O-antigen/teichoic acid export membrane protein
MKSLTGTFFNGRFGKVLTQVIGKPGSLRFRLIRDTVGVMVIQALSMGLGFAISVVLARLLSVREFGLYSLAISVLSFLLVPAAFGFPQLLVREIAAYRVKGEFALIRGLLCFTQRTSLLASLGIALLGGLVLWALSNRFSGEAVQVLALAFVALPFWALLQIYGEALRGFGQILTGQWVSMVMLPLCFLILVGTVWVFLGRIANASLALGLHIAAASIALALAFYLLRSQVNRSVPSNVLSPNTAIPNTAIWLRGALSLAFLTLLSLIPQHAGVLMLGWIRSAEEVGLYKVAFQTAALIPSGYLAVNTAIAPTLAQLYAVRNMAKLRKVMLSACAVATVFGLPLLLLFTVKGVWFLRLVFGEAFAGSATALAIITGGQMIYAITGPLRLFLIMSGHENKATLSIGIGSAFYLLSNIALIQLLGLNGAAMAFAVTWVVTSLLNLCFVLQIFRTKFLGPGGKA